MEKEREKAKRLEELNYKINMRRLKDSKMWDPHMPGSLTLKGRVDTAKWAYEQIMSLTPLKDLVKSYIQKHHISCPESIYQMDKPKCCLRSSHKCVLNSSYCVNMKMSISNFLNTF